MDRNPDDAPALRMPVAMQAAFQKLLLQFVAGLPQRWQQIESAATATELKAALHQLVGAAGSYGLQALGDAARQAEDAAHADDPAALATALAALRERVTEAIDTVR